MSSGRSQREKGIAFRALHARDRAFVIPNPWDAGTACLLASLGFEALATTSAGYAFSVARQDNTVPRDAMMEHIRAVAAATPLPVSADLGNGFGDDPGVVAETIRLVAAAGAVGGSIEDDSGRESSRLYDRALAVERIQAAVEAARALPFPFTLTARAENYLVGRPDLADVIARLRAYAEAGADVVYAPGLTRLDDVRAVVTSVDRPVNVLATVAGSPFTVAELSGAGVKRVSVGGALTRAAYGAVLRAAREMREDGTFTFVRSALSHAELNGLFGAGS
jgi:2-methylisocitrate lyase-like PEP mutase family enzyme